MRISINAESITVNADTPVVETDKTDVSTVINLKDMINLPMSGWRWDSFALSTPGTGCPTESGGPRKSRSPTRITF